MKRLIATILTLVMCGAMSAPIVFAIPNTTGTHTPEFKVTDYLKASDDHEVAKYLDEGTNKLGPITQIILKVIDIMVTVIGALAAMVLIVGGLMLATAGGSEQRLQSGKDTMVYAIIGIVVAFLSFIIVTFVQSILT